MILWFAWPEFYSMHAWRPKTPTPPWSPSFDQPIASGKFYVCIRNWIFALVMEMRKLQLDLFFTGSLGSFRSTLFSSIHFTSLTATSYQYSSFFFFFLASVYAGQKKTVFGNSRKTVWISFIHFGFSLRILPCCCWRPLVFGFVHLLFGLLRSMEMQSQREKKKNLKIYSCLMLIRFGSWINPIAKRPLGVKMEKQGACCKLTLRVSGCFRLCVCVCV